MGQQASDRDSTPSPHEIVFRGRYAAEIPGYILAGIALAAAVALGVASPLRDLLGVGVWVAWLAGGIGLVLGWATYESAKQVVKWVALSSSGIRWLYQGRIHSQPWSEFVDVERHITKCYYNGQYSGNMHSATVWFHSDEPLVISPHQMRGYEELIAEIQHRVRVLASQDGTQAPGRTAQPADIGW